MRKILLPTPDFPPARGGVARYLEAIKLTFPKEVEVLHWPNGIPARKEIVSELSELASSYDEIWVSHIFPVGSAALEVYLRKKIPYTIFLHGLDFDLARRTIGRKFLARLILKFAKTIVANSRALAEEIEKFCGRKVMVVYPTVPDKLIKAAQEEVKTPKHQEITLLTVARLVERKGHLKVLAAMKNIPNVKYLIIGDGPFKPQIENEIKKLRLQQRVTIKTDVTDDELPTVYRSADIFVMPTTKTKFDREGFGIVYLEAQLFSLPVIAVKHPGVDEAVIDKGTGILIADYPQDLEVAIKKLVDDPALRERMGAAGREFVLAGFNRETQFKKLASIL